MSGCRAIALLVAVLVGTGCSAGVGTRDELVVSAAASLTDVFADLAAAFETANPGAEVLINIGGSSALREQILEGAAVDVFASADVDTMDEVVSGRGVVAPPVVFAQNSLEIAVPVGNPGDVDELLDLANPTLFVGTCSAAVPCGGYALQVFANAGVVPSVDSEEPDVRALLTKIEAGELDAGLVYATDIAAAGGDVVGIAVPPAFNVVADYPIVALADAPNPTVATAFITFVVSAEGRRVLARHGFQLP